MAEIARGRVMASTTTRRATRLCWIERDCSRMKGRGRSKETRADGETRSRMVIYARRAASTYTGANGSPRPNGSCDALR